jgi:prepilin-type N-terminal cleavage/methylation domain-containing protein/prepilin-type processing-associated H-X9-DG protein
MCNQKKISDRHRNGFTLLELLLTISLVALLAGLVLPAFESLRRQAESTACASNLHQIGLGVLQKVQDNDNIYPLVEEDPDDPVYAPEDGAKSLAENLKPYGITGTSLRCPSDAKDQNHYGAKGSSYEWFSFIDGERAVSAKIYLPEGTLVLPLMRFPIAADYELVHPRKRMNILFADGHVDSYTGPGVREEVKMALRSTAH